MQSVREKRLSERINQGWSEYRYKDSYHRNWIGTLVEPKEFGLARFHCVSPNLCLEVLHPASGLNTPDLSGQATVKPLAWLRPCPCETPRSEQGGGIEFGSGISCSIQCFLTNTDCNS